jgi:lysyl-tRNA synthetase class II
MDRTHNPEFTMEIYVAYKDYNWMMKFAEDLLEHCAVAVNGTSEATFEHKINFKAPYARVTMTDSIKHFTVLIFQVKVKRNYLMLRKWELMWMPQWVKEN